jgi:GWxTD domain-containing protein
VAENYQEVCSHRKMSKVDRTILLKPGKYTAEAVLAVKNTQLKIPKTILFEVPDYISAGLGFTIPQLYAVPRQGNQVASVLKQLRAPHELGLTGEEQPAFFGLDKQPAIAFEIFSDSPLDSLSPCRLAFEVVDFEKNQTLYGRETVQLGRSGGAFLISFNVDEWEPGAYQFDVRAIMENPHREASTSLRFAIEFNRAMIGKYFNQTLEILSIIATDEELSALKNAQPGDRLRLWRDFWAKRDPNPDTEVNEALLEHLRRVQYASLNFSVSGPGWKSDRGKIYIKYGEPDHIESSTDAYLQGEYLIWSYSSIHVSFVFFDRFGLGDYHLIRTSRF